MEKVQVNFAGFCSDGVLIYEGATLAVEQEPPAEVLTLGSILNQSSTATGHNIFSFPGANSGFKDTSTATPFSFGGSSAFQHTTASTSKSSSTPFSFGGSSLQHTTATTSESLFTPYSFGVNSGFQNTSATTSSTATVTSSGRGFWNQTCRSRKEIRNPCMGSMETGESGSDGRKKPQGARPKEFRSFESRIRYPSPAEPPKTEGTVPESAVQMASTAQGGMAANCNEKHEIIGALFETQLKCLQIQNALQKLLFLRLKDVLNKSSAEGNGELAAANAEPGAQCCSEPSTVQSPSAGCEAVVVDAEDVPEELGQPLEALLRCSGIQVALQKNIASLLVVPNGDPSGAGPTADEPEKKTEQLSDDERLSEISWKLEEIFSKSGFQCGYRQNPFNVGRPRAGHSNDTIQEVVTKAQSFGFVFGGRKAQSKVRRRVPHGQGKLSTTTGEVIYEGKWHKGKRHGEGEALVVSQQSLSPDDTCGYYKGEWKDNMRHGHGSMWFPSGAKYVGQWQHDKISGCGVMSYRDGSTLEGTWCEGVLSGCGLFTWPHGATEYRQYEGNKVLHSSPVGQDAAKGISNRNQQSTRIQHLSARLHELKLEQSAAADAMENLRSTLGTELQNLEAQLEKMGEEASGQVAAALHRQEQEYEEKFKISEAKLLEAGSEILQLKAEVVQAKKRSDSLCRICFDRKRDCVIMPCTHLLYCRQCLAEHKKTGKNTCPACRGPISGELNCNLDQ